MGFIVEMELLKPRWHIQVQAGDIYYSFPAHQRPLNPVYFVESPEFSNSSLKIIVRLIVHMQFVDP